MKSFWKNKKVLVTGAAGFIGSHAVDALIERGAFVTAVISPNTKKEKIKQNFGGVLKNIVIEKVDLLDLNDCVRITCGQDIIFNFAAIDGGAYFKMKYPAKIFRVNSQITLNMLEAARHNKIDRFLLASSIEVYPGNLPTRINEKYGFREGLDERTEGYSWSKRLSELAAKMYHKEHGLQVAIARLGNTYGPRDYSDSEKGRVIPTFVIECMKGNNLTIVGDGMQERAFIYVTDLIHSLLKMVEKYPVGQPLNIAGNNYTTVKDLAEMVINLVGSKSMIVFNKNTIDFAKKRRISINKARKVIGFKEKISLKEGLSKTINYYNSIKK